MGTLTSWSHFTKFGKKFIIFLLQLHCGFQSLHITFEIFKQLMLDSKRWESEVNEPAEWMLLWIFIRFSKNNQYNSILLYEKRFWWTTNLLGWQCIDYVFLKKVCCCRGFYSTFRWRKLKEQMKGQETREKGQWKSTKTVTGKQCKKVAWWKSSNVAALVQVINAWLSIYAAVKGKQQRKSMKRSVHLMRTLRGILNIAMKKLILN